MNKIKRVLFIILMASIGLMSMTSCGKDVPSGDENEPENSESFILNKDVVLLEGEKSDLILNCSDNVITLANAAGNIVEKGRIICCDITKATPYGFVGRVMSVQNTTYGIVIKTEAVGLDEIFDELHIDGEYDISESVLSCVDSDGNERTPEMISDTVWRWLSEDYADSLNLGKTMIDAATRSKFSATTGKTVKVPIDCGGFSGNAYMKFGLKIKIDVSKLLKVKDYDINITKKTGVDGEWTLQLLDEGLEEEILSYEYKMSPIPIPNTPIRLVPSVYANMNLKAKAESKIVASMRYQFENKTYSYHYSGSRPTMESKDESGKNDKYFRFKEFSTSGTVTASFVAGGKLSLWNENILAVGVEAEAGVEFDANMSISTDDEDLLIDNPEITVNPSMTLSIYSESFLFRLLPDAEEGRISVSKTFDYPPIRLFALPKSEDVKVEKEDEKLSVESKINTISLLRCSEVGFALFKDLESAPVEQKRVDVQVTIPEERDAETLPDKASCEFDAPEISETMYVKPYVISEGRCYYGEPIRFGRKLISEVRMSCSDGYSVTNTFKYDEKGRLSYRLFTEREPESGAWSSGVHYSYDNGYVREHWDVNPYDNDCWYRFSDGYVVESYNNEDHLVDYRYDQGKVIKAFRSPYSFNWKWNNGDLVSFDYIGGAEETSASYSFYDIENNMNIDIYDFWEERFDGLSFFDRSIFPMFSSQHLLKSSNENHSYMYDIDENEDVIGMTVHAGGDVYHVTIDYY